MVGVSEWGQERGVLADVDSSTSLFLHELCQSLPGLPSVTIPTRSVTIVYLRASPVKWERVKFRAENSVLELFLAFALPPPFPHPCPSLVWSGAPLLDHIGQMSVLQCTMACHFTLWRPPTSDDDDGMISIWPWGGDCQGDEVVM